MSHRLEKRSGSNSNTPPRNYLLYKTRHSEDKNITELQGGTKQYIQTEFAMIKYIAIYYILLEFITVQCITVQCIKVQGIPVKGITV